MATMGPNLRKKKATHTSDTIGTFIAAFTKLAIFQPIDTIATNALVSKEKVSQFKADLAKANWLQKIRMFYSGAMVELIKKLPSNSYRFPMQRTTQSYIEDHYQETLRKYFGDHIDIASASLSGGITAVFEPCITQPLDAIVVNQQVYHASLSQTFRTFSFWDYYRSATVTGLLRNLPSGVVLFGGAVYLNQELNNEDKQNNQKNLAAKVVAGFGSALAAQPGDVLKVNMQTHRWSFSETVQKIPIKQFFTNGVKFRLMGGVKAGVGFFLVEKAMDFSAQIFGEEQPMEEFKANRKRRREN